MTAPLLAGLVALALAGALVALVPVLLRGLPVPQEEPGLAPFSDLDSRRLRAEVFVSAALAGLVAFALVPVPYWAVWAPLATIGSLLAAIDLRTTFLPLRLNHLALALSLAGAGIAAWSQGAWQPLAGSLAGAVGAAAFFWIAWRLSRGTLGFGDVRLAGLIGAVTGAHGLVLLVWAFLLGTACGAVWALVARVRRGPRAEFPYGPALLLGPFLALVVQEVAAAALPLAV